MAFDYKKEYKEFYLPSGQPQLVTVPEMNFLAVRGKGEPNLPDGAYKQAIGLLYGVAYTIKMSKMGTHKIDGYFDYVVPPLEGLWWQDGVCGVDYTRKEDFQWISLIRLPEFVTREVFDWAVDEAADKRKKDSAFSVCISAPMTTNRKPFRKCSALCSRMIWCLIFHPADIIMKSI